MQISLALPAFDSSDPFGSLGNGSFRSPADKARDEGFAAGHAAAQAEQQDQTADLAAQIGESLADIALDLAAQRSRMQQILGEILVPMFDAIAPGLAQCSLKSQLIEAMQQAMAEAVQTPVTVRVAAVNAPPVQSWLAAAGATFVVRPGPDLSAHAVEVDFGLGATCIDTDAAIARCRALIARHLTFEPKETGHDRRKRFDQPERTGIVE